MSYLCYYQWLQFTPLTEGDTSPLTGASPHTAVFSIRTVVCGTTRQNKSIRKSGCQLVPSCNVSSCWHCSPIRELPHYISSGIFRGVAGPGTWWSIGRTSSWSNSSERDDLSSVVNARLIGCCQSICMPLIRWLPNLPATSTSYRLDNSTRFLTVILIKASCTAYQLTQSLPIHKRNTSQQTAEK